MSPNKEALNVLPNDTVRTALLEIIEENIPSQEYNISIERGSEKGDNYIGIVHRLSITYKENALNENSEKKKLGLFVKVPPDSVIRREQYIARPCFLRESLMYDEFLPLLAEFQESKGIIPGEDGFKEYARCYKCITTDLKEAIFMEDLKLKGFVMHDRFKSPSVELVKVVMRALGKLHALSFAIKDQKPKIFAKFRQLDDVFIHPKSNPMFQNYINSLSQIALQSLSQEGDEKYVERVKALFETKTLFNQMIELVDGSKAEPYAVVCHGDCWNNNILFKYENGKPVDARLIDWQISRYASPVCDLMYYIFCCTSKSLRDQHYDDILNVYYTEFATFSKRLGSYPPVLFSRKNFAEQLKKFGAFALGMGLFLIPSMNAKAEDIADQDELSLKLAAGDEEFTKNAMQKNIEACSSRIRDLIVDLIRLEYI